MNEKSEFPAGAPAEEREILIALRDGDLPFFQKLALRDKNKIKEFKYEGLFFPQLLCRYGHGVGSALMNFYVGLDLFGTERKLSTAIVEDNLSWINQLSVESPEFLFEYKGAGELSVLHMAAEYGRDNICQLLIDIGFNVNFDGNWKRYGVSSIEVPLSEAARKGHLTTMKLLLSAGAYVDGVPYQLTTPLISAIVADQYNAVRMLLDAGCDVNSEMPELAFTALDYANSLNYDAISSLLRKHGAIELVNASFDWGKEQGSPFTYKLEKRIGKVLPEIVSWLPSHEMIKVRQAKIAPRDKNNVLKKERKNYFARYMEKILITINLYARIGKELCICLNACWPLNRCSSEIKDFNFPTRILYRLGEIALAGKEIEHGTFFDSRDDIFDKLGLPEGHVILISRFEKINLFGVEDSEFQNILMVHYFDSQGDVLNTKTALKIANKKCKSSWAAVAHMPDLREQSIYSSLGRP